MHTPNLSKKRLGHFSLGNMEVIVSTHTPHFPFSFLEKVSMKKDNGLENSESDLIFCSTSTQIPRI